MKSLFFAALAALSLSAAIVPAYAASSSIADVGSSTRMQQTGAYGRE